MSTSYPTTAGQQPGPLPQKGEPVPPPYNNQLPGGVPPQPGYMQTQQPPQQYGGQYTNQGYQPGPQPMMAGPPMQQYGQMQQQQQPPPQVTVQAVTVVAPNQQGSSNTWYQSFCGCFDNFMICLATFFCQECVFFCVTYYGKMLKYFIMSYICVAVAAFFYLIYYLILAMSDEYTTGMFIFLVFCWIVGAGAGVARIILFAVVRLRIREAYNIRGTVIEDCFFAWCCSACTTCQLMAEVDHQLDLQGEKTIFNRT